MPRGSIAVVGSQLFWRADQQEDRLSLFLVCGWEALRVAGLTLAACTAPCGLLVTLTCVRELGSHHSAEQERRRDDHSRDKGNQEAVFDRRSAFFIAVGATTA